MAEGKKIEVSSYAIFDAAISVVNVAKTSFENGQKLLSDCCTKLNSDSVFMGPICDSCIKGFSKVKTKMSDNISKYDKINTYLGKVSTEYQSSDAKASNLLIGSDFSIGSSVSSGNTQATSLMGIGDKAYEGDSAAQKEWIDKMAAIVKPYCQKYGFPESVLLAQIIQESGWSKSGSWLNENNNILNVNSEMFGSGDYKVAKNGQVNENASIPKWASNPKHASGPVSGGAYFESPRTDSMRAYDNVEDCVEDYLALMVGYRPDLKGSDVNGAIEGVKHYAEDASYSSKLASAINKYNLTKYDV